MLACLIGFSLLLFGLSRPAPSHPPLQVVSNLYQANLTRFDTVLADLTRQIDRPQSANEVQAAFRRARLAYKHIETLTEYYFLQSAKNLNGPNVPEGEVDDGVAVILLPEGFQVIEPALFPFDTVRRTQLRQQLMAMHRTVAQLRQLSAGNPLSDAFIFDALRQEVFRLETLGITGFDSPVAQHSLPEAVSALDNVQQTLACYPLASTNPALATRINQTIAKAQRMLRSARSFNTFDRLAFIRTCTHPLMELLLDAHRSLGIPLPEGRRLLRASARTPSDPTAFDPGYFANHSDLPSTPARIALGKRLFNDPILAAEGSGRSCAGCHQPDRAFQDGLKVAQLLPSDSKTITHPTRNTPTLWNAGLQSAQFLDMRVFTLEQQLNDVIHNSHEMGGSLAKAVIHLNSQETYRTRFKSEYTEGLTAFTVKHALATYVRSLVSVDSRSDRYLRGLPVALTSSERLGFNVFMGKAKCATCHYFPLYNGTLPPAYRRTESEVIGTPATPLNKQLSPDSGRGGITQIDFHRGAFKIPSLRHIGQTAPYMHNGVYTTLEQVVDFYDKGGGLGLGFPLPNQTLPPEPLHLTATEKRALVAFLKSL
ncbi:cytochrome c peroxidase [Fibrella aquatica]|uniref:cytochrome c peroxidase n=1 Tax=Fibrella aquatica TaxID=3242487 RepID=UPI003520EA57